ncbi:MAG: NAD(P)-dependent oxidoreductase [Clostridia bacterium]|nr:NAD(P)-dependent oxidoreductase [Clostridia bacterium]
MKLLITGASGFLGGRAAAMLGDRFEVLAPGHAQLEITDREAVRRYFREARPDLVFHCAAMSDVGQCEREPERSRRINIDGARNIAGAASEIGAKCLLCSSDQVYAGSAVMEAHREDEAVEPAPLYGREKLSAERECLAVNPDAVLLRLTWMYDTETIVPGEKSDFFRGLLARRKEGAPLRYSLHDRRGLTYVRDVVRNLVPAFELPGGVYNFGSPNTLPVGRTMAETVREILRRADLNPSAVEGDPGATPSAERNLCMDPAKLESYGIRFPETSERIGELLAGARLSL